ncbi:MAG: BamA/TamA family outer membrane protein [Flavisolibacter sp.]
MFHPAEKLPGYLCLLVIAAFPLFFTSCIVKNYPVRTPFVYETNINIEGKYTTDEKKVLKAQLDQQLHDSLRAPRERKFLFWQVLDKPPVFDTVNTTKSMLFMTALLNSLGYYRGNITSDTVLNIKGDQFRTTVNFTVDPGKLITLDSIAYDLRDSAPHLPQIDTLQMITVNSLDQRLLRKGDPFSKPLISSELDRLSDLYRNSGYLRFSKEQLLGVWDTVGLALLRPTLDPIEQAQQLEVLRRRRENPSANLGIRLKRNPDILRLTRYYVGNVKVFPDYNSDTAVYQPTIDTLTRNKYQFISYENLFKPKKLLDYIHLHRGALYRQSDYLETQNKFNSIAAWRLVSINQLPRPGEDTVDFEIRLVPAPKYVTSVNFDVSKNQSSNPLIQGNLLGLGINFSLVNRNFAKAANQSALNFRYGIELASKINTIQTQQVNLNYTIQFPRLAPRMKIPRNWREDARTFLSFNAGFVDRLNYYKVNTLNGSLGYEFPIKKMLLTIRLPNIEYNLLQRRSTLDELISKNASLRYIFNDGLIVSSIVNITAASGRRNLTTVKSGSVEFAGIPGFIRTISPDTKQYRFVKTEAQIVQTRTIRRTALVWRVFGGMGYGIPFPEYRGQKDSFNLFLPFFRQYYAGGPNSMRAWSIRKLGPGSTIKSFTSETAPDRFGDIRLEANLEYRYYITKLVGFPLEGALFTDMGNVWFLRENKDFPNGEFNIRRLWNDLAVGVGTGFRIDFGLLKLRLDFAWKAKDPSPDEINSEAQNKWFYNWSFLGTSNGKRGAQFQLGIDYPF